MAEVASDPHASPTGLTEREADALLDVAEKAIRERLPGGSTAATGTGDIPVTLEPPAGVFVTLHVDEALNGCIGSLDRSESLAESVADLAVRAAFEDPRLPPLRTTDLTQLHIEVSVLSARLEIPARSRQELLHHLVPVRHGLVVRRGVRQATFLPAVWRQLPHPDRFVDRLLSKAGLTPSPWPDDLVAEVFTTTSVHRRLG